MANWHHQSIKANFKDLEVVAAYDIDPERLELARKNGLKAYETADDFLALLADAESTGKKPVCFLHCCCFRMLLKKEPSRVPVRRPYGPTGAEAPWCWTVVHTLPPERMAVLPFTVRRISLSAMRSAYRNVHVRSSLRV